MEALDKYIKRTGESRQDALGGLSFFGFTKLMELLDEANKLNKRIVYYYATDEDRMADVLSYKFE